MTRRLLLPLSLLAFLFAASAVPAIPCPGTGAKLKVIINNPTTSTGQTVTISGNMISSQGTCTGQQDTYSKVVTLTQTGDNEFIIPTGGGLDTGMWLNHISAGNQYQHQQRPVLFTSIAADYATARWTYYPTVLTVNQAGDAATADCIFTSTCTFRQAITSATLLAQFTSTPAVLVQFSLSPGTMTQTSDLSVGVPTDTTIITIDGTDANGDPWIVGDALATAQGSQDAFTRTVDLADKTKFVINGDNVALKGFAITNTVASGVPSKTLVESSGANTRIEAVRLDGGATGACGTCVDQDKDLLSMGGGEVVNVEGRAAFSHGARLGFPSIVRDSWFHHNYASGVLANGVLLSRNTIELTGRGLSGAVVTLQGVGVRGDAAGEIDTAANLIRNHTSFGVDTPLSGFGLDFTDDYVCGNGDGGMRVDGGAGANPIATGTGLTTAYNAFNGIEFGEIVPSSMLNFNNNSAFTANGGCGFVNTSGVTASAINNQWRGATSSCSQSPDRCPGSQINCDPIQSFRDVAISIGIQATFPSNVIVKGQTVRVQGSGFNAIDGNPLNTAPTADCELGSDDVSADNCCRKPSKANVCGSGSPPAPPTDFSNCVALRDAATRWRPLAVTSVTPSRIVTEVPDTVFVCTGGSSNEVVRVVKNSSSGPISAQGTYCLNTASL